MDISLLAFCLLPLIGIIGALVVVVWEKEVHGRRFF